MNLDDIDRLGDEIAEVAAHLNAGTHRLITLIRDFDERGGWAAHGALSCAHWLSWRIGLAPGAAREKVRIARALGALPSIDDALRRGELSYSQVRAMTRVATPENEKKLLDMARASTAGQLEKLCRRYGATLRSADPVLGEDRYVRTSYTDDGMVRLDAKLRPEEAAIVSRAIEAARAALGVSAETSRADGLVAMAESYLARGAPEKPIASPVEVVIHVDASDHSATLDDGTPLPDETTRRLTCDCAMVRVTEDDHGSPLDVGRRTRSIPAALKTALRLRDDGCRFPGCTNRIYVDAHHIRHWIDGGETKLGNLCLLCRRHHTLVHEGQFAVMMRSDGSPRFQRSDGREIDERPPSRPGDLAAIRAWNEQAGLDLDADTTVPYWDGERMDYSVALEVLWNPGSGSHGCDGVG